MGWSCRSRSQRQCRAAWPHRVPRIRDRAGRAADLPGGAGVPAGQALVDRPGRQRHLRRGVPGRGRRHPPIQRVPPGGRPTWVLTRASTSQAQARHAQDRSRSKAPRRRWALVESAQSVVQQPAARLLRAHPRPQRPQRRVVAVARKLAVLFHCMLTHEEDYAHQQPSLTAKKLRAARGLRRPTDPQGQAHRGVGHPPADASRRARARPTGRGLLQALRRRLESRIAQEDKGGRERYSGARVINAPLGGQRRAAGYSQPRKPGL